MYCGVNGAAIYEEKTAMDRACIKGVFLLNLKFTSRLRCVGANANGDSFVRRNYSTEMWRECIEENEIVSNFLKKNYKQLLLLFISSVIIFVDENGEKTKIKWEYRKIIQNGFEFVH